MRPIATTRMAAGIPTGRLAVWWVLASEIVIFGGLLASYIMHRIAHPEWGVQAANTNVWLGGFNTFVLLTSSLSAVLAHKAAVSGDGPKAAKLLYATCLGAVIFLVTAETDVGTTYILAQVEDGNYGISVAYGTVLIMTMLAATILINLMVGKSRVERQMVLE